MYIAARKHWVPAAVFNTTHVILHGFVLPNEKMLEHLYERLILINLIT